MGPISVNPAVAALRSRMPKPATEVVVDDYRSARLSVLLQHRLWQERLTQVAVQYPLLWGGLDQHCGNPDKLIDHAKQMHGWSGAVFQGGKRDGKHWAASHLMVCECDAVKFPDSDVIDWVRTVEANPRIEDIEKLPFIAAAYLSQRCNPSKGVFVGRLIATINEPITNHYKFKAAAELFHRDVEAATGCVITDRCGCDKVRW